MFLPVWYVSCIILSFPSQIFTSENTDLDCPQGILQTCDELDKYEKMWHTCIYQPSWSELKTEVREYNVCVPIFVPMFRNVAPPTV